MNLWALKIDLLKIYAKLIKNAHNISLAVHSRLPTHEINAQNGYEIGKRCVLRNTGQAKLVKRNACKIGSKPFLLRYHFAKGFDPIL